MCLMWRISELLMLSPSGLTQGGCNVMASWLQHSLFTDMADGIFSSHRAPSKEKGQLIFKRSQIPDSFQARVFKNSVRGEGHRIRDQLLSGFRTT